MHELAEIADDQTGADVQSVRKKKKAAGLVVVRCPRCGSPRAVSERHARRITHCPDCAKPDRALALRMRYMRFWLRRYSDEEIAWMAAVIHDVPNRPDLVAEKRLRLLP